MAHSYRTWGLMTKTLVLITGFLFTGIPSAIATAAEMDIEEVLVTARRSSESLSDVPMAVTAFTSAEIEDAGIQRPEDFINLTSNVVMVNTANVGDSQVTIRGITSTRDAESNFALVVDGVLITNPNAFNRELLDVAQIEVLKGPQGALYGRNASSGAILITTNKPSEEFEGSILASGGDNASSRYQGHISGALADNLFGRLSFSHRESDGEFKNLYRGGNNVDFLEDDTVRGRLIYEMDTTKLDFRIGTSQADSGTINFNATFALPSFTSFGTPGDELFFADVNDHNFKYMFNVPPVNEQETEDMSLKVDHTLGSGNVLTAILSVSDLDEKLLSDGTSAAFGGYQDVPECAASVTDETLALVNLAQPGFFFGVAGDKPIPVGLPGGNSLLTAYTPLTCDGYQYQERNQNDKSLELRIASAEGEDIQWLAGVFYATIEREVVVAYGADLGQGFLQRPYVSPSGPNPTDLLFWDDFDTTVASIFGQIIVDLTEDLELSFEGRFDREDREVHNKVPALPSALLFGGGAPLNPARTLVDDIIPDRDDVYSQFQPKLAVRYDLDDDTSLYASYGVGFRSGGFNSIGSQALTEFWFNSGNPFGLGSVNANLKVSDEYDKEVTTAYEFGFKGSYLDGRLKVNGALFQTDVEDNQFFEFFAGPFGLLRVVTTIDELQLRGAEVDVTYMVTDYFKLYGGFGITDGEIKKNNHRPETVGNEAPLSPDYTFNLGGQFKFFVGNGLELVARLDYLKVGETWFHTVQNNQQPAIWTALLGFPVESDMSQTKRDPYDTIDLRISLHAENWSITAWGRNVGDEDYLAEVIAAPEFGGSFIHDGPKRTVGVDFTYRF